MTAHDVTDFERSEVWMKVPFGTYPASRPQAAVGPENVARLVALDAELTWERLLEDHLETVFDGVGWVTLALASETCRSVLGEIGAGGTGYKALQSWTTGTPYNTRIDAIDTWRALHLDDVVLAELRRNHGW